MKSILTQLNNNQIPRNRQASEPSPNNKIPMSPINIYKKNSLIKDSQKQQFIKKQIQNTGSGSLGEKSTANKAENSKILSSILNYQKSQCLSNLSVQPQHRQVVIQLQLDNKENVPSQTQTKEAVVKSEGVGAKIQHQNVPVSHSRRTSRPNCGTHIDKQAKYRCSGQATCSQCTIAFAIAKGLPIQVLKDENKLLTFGQEDDDMEKEDLLRLKQVQLANEDMATKLNGVESFIRKLNTLLRESRTTTLYLAMQRTDQQSLLQSQLEQVIKNIINKTRNDSELVVISDSVSKYTKDAEYIKKDILDNIQNIIQFMELGPFNLIIGKYREKLRQFESSLEQYSKVVSWCSKEVDTVVQKISCPEFLNQLSSLLEQQLEQQEQQRNCFTMIEPQITSPPPVKYRELLNKVNQTQASTTMFYNSILGKTTHHKENGRYKTEIPKYDRPYD